MARAVSRVGTLPPECFLLPTLEAPLLLTAALGSAALGSAALGTAALGSAALGTAALGSAALGRKPSPALGPPPPLLLAPHALHNATPQPRRSASAPLPPPAAQEISAKKTRISGTMPSRARCQGGVISCSVMSPPPPPPVEDAYDPADSVASFDRRGAHSPTSKPH